MIFILNNFLLNKNMFKYLLVNIVLLLLFFIFLATNDAIKFTPLGLVVLAVVYFVSNLLFYQFRIKK